MKYDLEDAIPIAEGHNSEIFLYKDKADNKTAILKTLKDGHNHFANINQLINEDQQLKNLNIKGVRNSLDLVKIENRQVLVLEYIDGRTLKDIIVENKYSLLEKLRIAVSLSNTLGEIHNRGVIHKDLNSFNILVDSSGTPHIIDFGLSTEISIKTGFAGISDKLEGTLPYISPEQTGRMNHAVDYRSDLYSFGVILYELFTGELPFKSDDPVEIVHAHLAISPTPPTKINESLPSILADIVVKLLSKKVEDRYQSAFGVLADLETCLKQVNEKLDVKSFELATNDFSQKFMLPGKLYGRDEEIKRLLDLFEDLENESKIFAFVEGYSGTGKTSLVHEIHKPITAKRGNFISGKFEQFQRNTPYYAIKESVNNLTNILLGQSETEIQYWKEIIENAVGNEGKLLTNLVPNMELIIGPQPDLDVLGINEELNQFSYMFTRFIAAIANEKHPLVIFIDDLQWVDSASLGLIEQLAINEEIEHLFFIGSYRSNEIDDTHPLVLSIEKLEKKDIHFQTISIGNLIKNDVKRLVADTLNSNPEQCIELTDIIYSKTGGNAFFVNQFLKSIHEQGLIRFELVEDKSQQIKKGRWTWDIDELKKLDFTDNVVDLMIRKINSLDEDVREVLKLASCIGDEFNLIVLEYINSYPIERIVKALWKSLKEELIVLVDGWQQIPSFSNYSENGDRIKIQYRFAHDKIRQAAYQLIPDNKRNDVHLEIGKLLLKNISEQEIESHVFDITYHLNKENEDKLDKEVKLNLVQLNFVAGRKAQQSSAPKTALNHYEVAIKYSKILSLTFEDAYIRELYNEATQCAYLVGDYQKMEAYSAVVHENSNSPLDIVKIVIVKMHALSAQGKELEAIELGISIIRDLGIKLPLRPKKSHIARAYLHVKLLTQFKNYKQLEQYRPMKNEHMKAILDVFNNFGTAAYHKLPELFPLLVLTAVKIIIKHGNIVTAIPFYAGYGLLECALGNYDTGYIFGNMSLKQLESVKGAELVKARTYITYYTFINHWKQHIKFSVDKFLDGYHAALETGDNVIAASSLFMHTHVSFYIGENLDTLIQRAVKFHDKINGLKQETYTRYNAIICNALLTIAGKDDDLLPFKPNLPGSIDKLTDGNYDKTEIFHVYFFQLITDYLNGNYAEAYDNIAWLEATSDIAIATDLIPIYKWYESLIIVELVKASRNNDKKFINRLKKNQKEMKGWSKHAPMNYLHKFQLIEAEINAINGNINEADKLYQEAAKYAAKNDYTNELGIIYELQSQFYHRLNKNTDKETAIKRAYEAYKSWGTKMKADQLFAKHHNILEIQHSNFTRTSSSFSTLSGTSKMLDMAAILKASSALTQEIQLNKSIPQLLKIVIENAGAQRGVFLLMEKNKLEIHATGDMESGIQMIDTNSQNLHIGMANTVVQYVKRSKENVVIDNAKTDERFGNDSYVLANNIGSILCIPVINQSELLAIIYLENNLIEGAFTKQRLQVLAMLSGQIAVTLRNSLLYTNLEQKVKERTAEIEKQKEELKSTNFELIQINQEKDDLISIVSHDLRSPLNQIKGLSKLATYTDDKKELEDINSKIFNSAERLSKMITRILDISAIESQEINLQPESFDIIQLLQELVSNFQNEANNKDINLAFITNKESGLISLDKSYLIQIINNLLSNAIKFTPSKGQVELIVNYSNGSVQIEVKDNGPGISKSDQKRLFNKFQKLSAQPTGGEASSGLGLAIVKKYIEAMDGDIEVNSDVDKGASFIINF